MIGKYWKFFDKTPLCCVVKLALTSSSLHVHVCISTYIFPTTFQVKLSNSSEEDFVNRLLQLERHHVKTRQMEYEEKRRARQEAAMEAAKEEE